MVHVDLDSIKQKWYDFGRVVKEFTTEDRLELKALDSWQRNEVLAAYSKGAQDRVEII